MDIAQQIKENYCYTCGDVVKVLHCSCYHHNATLQGLSLQLCMPSPFSFSLA